MLCDPNGCIIGSVTAQGRSSNDSKKFGQSKDWPANWRLAGQLTLARDRPIGRLAGQLEDWPGLAGQFKDWPAGPEAQTNVVRALGTVWEPLSAPLTPQGRPSNDSKKLGQSKDWPANWEIGRPIDRLAAGQFNTGRRTFALPKRP